MKKACTLILVIAILAVSFNSQSCYAARNVSKRKACGPTINLDYGQDQLAPNPVSTFAYFVPLVAHTPIENWMSNGHGGEEAFRPSATCMPRQY